MIRFLFEWVHLDIVPSFLLGCMLVVDVTDGLVVCVELSLGGPKLAKPVSNPWVARKITPTWIMPSNQIYAKRELRHGVHLKSQFLVLVNFSAVAIRACFDVCY